MNLRLLHKIVQREHASCGWQKCSRDLRIAGIGPVLLSADHVLVDWGMKRFLHLAGGAGELNQSTSSGRAHLKAVRLEPRRDGLNVGIGRAELFAELCGSEPLVIVRRSLVLLIVEQTPEGGLLLRTALQNQQHPFHRKAGRRCAEVEFWTR